MNLSQLSYELLQEAVTKGTMTLENGTIYEITSSQLITITKFLIGNTSPTSNTESEDDNIPEEMLLFPVDTYTRTCVCYKCHQERDYTQYISSCGDPMSQVCNICKEEK